MRTVSDPITTPHNFTPGAVAYQAGVTADIATPIQCGTVAVTLVAVVVAAVGWSTAARLVPVAVIASQLVSPILWDHYAMLLLLPVAYLLAAGRWWAVAIPLATSLPLLGIVPADRLPGRRSGSRSLRRAGRGPARHGDGVTRADGSA